MAQVSGIDFLFLSHITTCCHDLLELQQLICSRSSLFVPDTIPLLMYPYIMIYQILFGSLLAQKGGGSNSINVCSPPDFGKMFTKINKNRQQLFFCALRVPGCLLLMCVHLKWYVNHIGYDWECF